MSNRQTAEDSGVTVGSYGTARVSNFKPLAKVQFRQTRRFSKLDLAIWQAPVLKPELLYGPYIFLFSTITI